MNKWELTTSKDSRHPEVTWLDLQSDRHQNNKQSRFHIFSSPCLALSSSKAAITDGDFAPDPKEIKSNNQIVLFVTERSLI